MLGLLKRFCRCWRRKQNEQTRNLLHQSHDTPMDAKRKTAIHLFPASIQRFHNQCRDKIPGEAMAIKLELGKYWQWILLALIAFIGWLYFTGQIPVIIRNAEQWYKDNTALFWLIIIAIIIIYFLQERMKITRVPANISTQQAIDSLSKGKDRYDQNLYAQLHAFYALKGRYKVQALLDQSAQILLFTKKPTLALAFFNQYPYFMHLWKELPPAKIIILDNKTNPIPIGESRVLAEYDLNSLQADLRMAEVQKIVSEIYGTTKEDLARKTQAFLLKTLEDADTDERAVILGGMQPMQQNPIPQVPGINK